MSDERERCGGPCFDDGRCWTCLTDPPVADPVPAPTVNLDAIRARAEAATPGPWSADVLTRGDCVVWGPDGEFLMNAEAAPHWTPDARGNKRAVSFDVDRRDAAFIAAARTAVPALVAELSALRAREAQVRELCADEHSQDEAITEHHAGNDGPWLARSVLAVLDGTTGSGKTG